MTLQEKQEGYLQELGSLEDEFDQYTWLMQLACQRPELCQVAHQEERRFLGCQSNLWVELGCQEGRLSLSVDSDTLIVKGLAVMLADIVTGCTPQEVYFTSCGTEGNNWAIRRGVELNRRKGKHIITTAIEHAAVLETCRDLERQSYEVTYLKPDREGRITPQDLAAALRPDTALVSMMLVNNETGVRFPVEEVAAALKGKPTLLHTDAIQGFLKVPFTAASLGADLIALSGHKVGGPKGIGALYIGQRVKNPKPLLAGGEQESGLRAGTEATAQIAGFAKAAELRLENLEDKLRHMARIRDYAVERLTAIPDLKVLSAPGGAPHVLSVSLVGWPSQNIVNDLGQQGICISAGSACHKGKASHVLTAMGLSKKEAAGTIRVSFGPETTREDIDAFADALRAHQKNRFPML